MIAPPGNERGPQPRQGRDPHGATVGTDDAAHDSATATAEQAVDVDVREVPDAASAACTWALAYASIGWPVFPCKPDKRPHTEHGFHDATTDTETIRAWWRRWPDAQIGVACGAAGLVVVDLDVDNSKGANGPATWREFLGAEPHGCGLIATTPRGGRHYVYLDAEHQFGIGADVANLRGIDVRGTGGYIIVPSPASPGRDWIDGDPLDGDECLPVPAHVAEILPAPCVGGRLTRRGKMAHAGTATDERLAEVESALLWLAPSMKRLPWLRAIWGAQAALDADERGAELVERWSSSTDVEGQYEAGEAAGTYATAILPWNAPANRRLVDAETLFYMAKEKGWTWTPADRADAELQAVIAATPKPAPQVAAPDADDSAFPAHLVEGDDLISAMVADIVDTATVPQPSLALGTTIATLGAVMGRRVQARGQRTTTRTNVYSLLVGSTASGKNGPRVRCVDLLARAGLHDRIGPREYKSDSGIYATLQTLPSHVAYIDEIGMVLHAMTNERAPAHLRQMVAALLTIYSSASTTLAGAAYANQQLNPMKPICEPCLSLAGFSTPETFTAAMSSRNVADGLVGRMLLFLADEKARKCRGMFHAATEARSNGEDAVARLIALKNTITIGDLPDLGGPTGDRCRTLTWTTAAADYFDDVLLPIEEAARRRDHLGGVWVRLIEHVSKIALIRAVACDPTATTIDVGAVQWAHELVSWCLGRMHRLIAEHVADNQIEADGQRLLRIVRDAGPTGISGTMLTRRTQWLGRSARKELVTSLIEGEQLCATSVDADRADGKGRPKVIYTLPQVSA